MPITQDRMIQLIAVADAMLDVIRRTRARNRMADINAYAQEARELSAKRDATIDDLRQALALMDKAIEDNQLEISEALRVNEETIAALASEKRHFLERKGANIRSALAMRMRRMSDVEGADYGAIGHTE